MAVEKIVTQLVMVAVLDDKLGEFLPPMGMRTRGEALRAFSNMVNDPQNGNLAKHPIDFSLWEMGTFDCNNGLFSPPVGGLPVMIERAENLVKV